MSRCDCQWLAWIPRCYGHCKPKQVQLPDLSLAKDAEEVATIQEVADEAATIAKVSEEVAVVTKVSEEIPTITKVAEELAAVARDAEEVAIIREVADEAATITEVAEELATVAKDAVEVAAVIRCECFVSVPAVCKGLARCPLAKASNSARVDEIKAAAAVQPEHAQLIDFSTTTKEEENIGEPEASRRHWDCDREC